MLAKDTRSDADYIAKPYRPTIVQARVRSQLEVKHARDWLTDQNAVLEAEITHRMRDNLLLQDITIKPAKFLFKCTVTVILIIVIQH